MRKEWLICLLQFRNVHTVVVCIVELLHLLLYRMIEHIFTLAGPVKLHLHIEGYWL